jgi:hypothetical protein
MKKLLLGLLIGWFLYPTLTELDQLDWQLTWNKTCGDSLVNFNDLTERFQWIEKNRHLHFLNYVLWRPEIYRCFDDFPGNDLPNDGGTPWYCGSK